MDIDKPINEDEEQTELFLTQVENNHYLKEVLAQLTLLSKCALDSKEMLDSFEGWDIWTGLDNASKELIRMSVDVSLSFIIKWSNFELRQKEGCTIYPFKF